MIKSVYIHIPFCTQICSYCDFCKFYYYKKWISEYLVRLKQEIKDNYNNDQIETIYIGGGTPSSLSLSELKELLEITNIFNKTSNVEFTVECNSEDLTLEKLLLLKKYNVSRLSIGVQTFDKEILKTLNRSINIAGIELALKMFSNVNLDLMYAFPGQNIDDVKKDIQKILSLKPKHISLYSLMIEPHTKLFIQNVVETIEDIQSEMYFFIKKALEENGYNHYEISNFAKKGFESKHNLVYWNNLEYYGFGLSASGYVNGIRYENTRNLTKYLNGNLNRKEELILLERKIEDEFMLGFRKIKGINIEMFEKKYNVKMNNINIVNHLIKENYLINDGKNIYINPKYIYVSNEIILKFIDANLLGH